MTLSEIWEKYSRLETGRKQRADFRFDPDFYVSTTPELMDSHEDPLAHFLEIGIPNGKAGTTYWQVRQSFPGIDSTLERIITEPHLKSAILAGEPGANELAFELLLLGHPVDGLISDFSGEYYAALYPEVAVAGIDPWIHYVRHGQAENRRTLSHIRRNKNQGYQEFDPERPTCLICVHEFSRTGAPVVGLQLVKEASSKFNVVVCSLKQGELLEKFKEFSVLVLTSDKPSDDFEYFESFELDKVEFAILNSVECYEFMAPLVERDIPFACYLHEYTTYTLPSFKPLFTSLFADLLVFSAKHVRKTWEPVFQDVAFDVDSDSMILPQAPLSVGNVSIETIAESRADLGQILGLDLSKKKIVFGAGYAHWRKGTDLFVLTAQLASKLNSEIVFVWVGDGVNHEDFSFGVWMDQHLREIDATTVTKNLFFLPSGPLYKTVLLAADVMFLSSRMDPLPNVVFDAVEAGNRVVLFENASGFTDEVYRSHPSMTFVPFGDIELASSALLLAKPKDPSDRLLSALPSKEPFKLFDKIANRLRERKEEQRHFTLGSGDFDVPVMANSTSRKILARRKEREKIWSAKRQFVWKSTLEASRSLQVSPYAAHRASIIIPMETTGIEPWQNISMHLHAFYEEDLQTELLQRPALRYVNRLVITTDTEKKASGIEATLKTLGISGSVHIADNLGRDVLPFLNLFTEGGPAAADTDEEVWGHIHLKKSMAWSKTGDVWREFLLSTLIGFGDNYSNAACHAALPEVGLVAAFDPYIFGWGGSSRLLSTVAGKLPEALPNRPLVFPTGNMFLTRASVVRKMASIFGPQYQWPNEPLPNDGTVFHLIERLWPSVAASIGLNSIFISNTNQRRA